MSVAEWVRKALALARRRETSGAEGVAIARLEQYAPFPRRSVAEVLSSLPDLREIVWVQEEPRNMGARKFIVPELRAVAPAGLWALISSHPRGSGGWKRFTGRQQHGDELPPDLPLRQAQLWQPRLKAVGKAIFAAQAEVEANPRARSAVLRIAERPA